MKRLLWVLALSSSVAGVALMQQPTVRADGTCGAKGQPSCPLQGWMEKNMDPAVEKNDFKALGTAFEKTASLVPDPKWNDGPNSWSKLSQDGVAAAKSGDMAAAKKLCKSCHKAWRDKYKSDFRMKPVKG
jgi:hypothetical protein